MPSLLQAKLQAVHPNFAYELLELQISVEDQKLKRQPTINEVTKLLQLYMTGVEVLESISDVRFLYFNNKIQSLMMKRHVVKMLHKASGKNSKELSFSEVEKEQLKEKKNEYDLHCYYNKGRFDIKTVQQILAQAEKKGEMVQNKFSKDIKKQEDRLNQRIKERKMRSQNGSVHKFKIGSEDDRQENDQNGQNGLRDSRFEYFDDDEKKQVPKKLQRLGSTQKLFDKRYGKFNGGSKERRNPRDAL